MSSIRPKRGDTEEYTRAAALAAEVRATVAGQIHELIVEGDQAGSGESVRARVEQIVMVRRDILQARARQEQARAMGLPLAPSVRDEREGWEALRTAVMNLSVAAGEWVASLDFDVRKSELSLQNGSGKRRRSDEEAI